ncbi:MAG: aldo/keto reductase [Anderseniella sp.]|jgi:diketogulonate reductase-like aldo/keto reductase|nr:aldo/keto reductase [Anderseniella sp.]
MKHVTLPDGEKVPALGLGTWRMGEDPGQHDQEVATLKKALDRGLQLIDTAEMYAEGGAELVVADAIRGRRDEAFIVSKVYPHNASYDGVQAACERSLERLGTDRLDIYLLHWRGQVPLEETVAGFERLKADGKIRHWGVSNLDTADMTELAACPNAGNCATNQLLYNLGERGIEWDLKPMMAQAGQPVMAYCPLGEGRLLRDATLAVLAERHGVTPATIALAWLLSRDQTIAIPKTSRPERIEPILAALDVTLDAEDLALLDDEFPPPDGPTALAIV